MDIQIECNKFYGIDVYYNIVKTYTFGSDFVGYIIYMGKPCIIAHTDNRYSVKMLREILRLFNVFNRDVIAEIPSDILYDFWCKHFNISVWNKDMNLYRIRS